MESKYFYLVLFVSILGVLGSRIIPMFFFHRVSVPKWLDVWLNFLPISVIAAMLATDFAAVISKQPLWQKGFSDFSQIFAFFFDLTPGAPLHYIFSSFSVFLTMHLTRSLALGFLSGMFFYQVLFWL